MTYQDVIWRVFRDERGSVEVVYEVEADQRTVRAVGLTNMGWYEFVVLDSDGVVLEWSDEGYGAPAVALRDGLILATDPAPMPTAMR